MRTLVVALSFADEQQGSPVVGQQAIAGDVLLVQTNRKHVQTATESRPRVTAEIQEMARGKVFMVAIVKAGLDITPGSSGTPRTVAKSRIQLVCDKFNRSKSLRPGECQAITLDASYLLAESHW